MAGYRSILMMSERKIWNNGVSKVNAEGANSSQMVSYCIVTSDIVTGILSVFHLSKNNVSQLRLGLINRKICNCDIGW